MSSDVQIYAIRRHPLLRTLQLVRFARAPPEPRQREFFCPHFLFTLSLWEQEQNEAGKLARRIVRQLDSLWTFLAHEGVAPTNNRAERALRFAVLWRKRSPGTRSEKGNRWAEPDLAWI